MIATGVRCLIVPLRACRVLALAAVALLATTLLLVPATAILLLLALAALPLRTALLVLVPALLFLLTLAALTLRPALLAASLVVVLRAVVPILLAHECLQCGAEEFARHNQQAKQMPVFRRTRLEYSHLCFARLSDTHVSQFALLSGLQA